MGKRACVSAYMYVFSYVYEFFKQVKIFTFGFGSDHDEKLLLDIASAGQGSYYYIEKEDQIAAAFGDALGGLLSVIYCQITQVSYTLSPLLHLLDTSGENPTTKT